jgi:hypothetical protein
MTALTAFTDPAAVSKLVLEAVGQSLARRAKTKRPRTRASS